MKPVLLIFLDGLMPDRVAELDVLRNLPQQARVVGKYGYSIACHASMYTGKEVSEHKYWFVWQRNEGRGIAARNRWMRYFPFDNIPARLLYHKFLIKDVKRTNTSFFGIPRTVHCRSKDLVDFNVTEWKNYDEHGYINGEVSFLDLYRNADLTLDLVGFDKLFPNESEALKIWSPDKNAQITYWFIGDVDHFSHKLGQMRKESDLYFKKLNAIMNAAYERFVDVHGEEPVVLAWSDHGHAEVTQYFDAYNLGKETDEILKTTAHIVDATAIRFWRDNQSDDQWAKNMEIFQSKLGKWGDVLDEPRQRELNLWPGDNRYGDVVIALKRGASFKRTIWGFSRGVMSQHGYDPSEPEMDGFVASNAIEFSDERVPITDIYYFAREIANV